MHIRVFQEFLLNDAAKNIVFMRNYIILSTLSGVHVHSPESVTNNAITPTPACGWMRRCLQAKLIRKRLIKARNRRVGLPVKSGKHGGIINGGSSVLSETLYPVPIYIWISCIPLHIPPAHNWFRYAMLIDPDIVLKQFKMEHVTKLNWMLHDMHRKPV